MSQPGGQELAGSAAQDGAAPSHQAGQTWALVAAQPGHRGSRGTAEEGAGANQEAGSLERMVCRTVLESWHGTSSWPGSVLP